MDKDQSKKNAMVRRITVDEKLGDDLIRLMISPLADGVEEFHDASEYWKTEEECYIQRDTYVRKMNVPASMTKECQWTDLQEGQVFLSGQFEELGTENAPKKFVVSTEREHFLRIDKLVKEDLKRLYFQVLERREKHGNSH